VNSALGWPATEAYRADYLETGGGWQWQTEPEQIRLCPRHRVYMHALGCVICNGAPCS
jgi:hypothetical protein